LKGKRISAGKLNNAIITTMIVAVTGATGHIGANLTRALVRAGQQVRALVFKTNLGIHDEQIETVKGDVRDPASLRALFEGVELVYHLAAVISISSGDRSNLEATNVAGTRNVVEAALKANVRRLIHFSSIHALTQTPLDIPVDESRPLVDGGNCPPYDRSKALAEREVRQGIENGLDAVIINPTGVIGPYDFQLSLFGQVLLNLVQARLPALVQGGFNWVDVRDVVSAAIKAQTQAPIGAKYLLSGHYATVVELAKIVEEISGTAPPRLTLPAWMARGGAPLLASLSQMTGRRPLYTSVAIQTLQGCNLSISHQRAARELDYHPRPLKETIFDSLRWYQNAGMLDQSIKLKQPK
jgi:dihydroflavonol-4-reductase